MLRNCIRSGTAAVGFDARVNGMTSALQTGDSGDSRYVNNLLKVKTFRRSFKMEWVAPGVQNSTQTSIRSIT